MSVFMHIPPLLVVAVTVACTSPSTGTAEDRSGNATATITSSPSSAGDGTGAEGSAGDGADGQDGRSGRGDDTDGKDSGTPATSSHGPDRGSLSVANNDVIIGARFGSVRHPFSFGSTSPGSTITRTVTVGSSREVTVSSVEVTLGSDVFRIVEDGCTGASLPGQCNVTLGATPPTEGKHPGVIKIANTLEPTSLDLEVTAEANDRGLSGPTGVTGDAESTQPQEPLDESTQSKESPTTPG